jgi:hypothetical protein
VDADYFQLMIATVTLGRWVKANDLVSEYMERVKKIETRDVGLGTAQRDTR